MSSSLGMPMFRDKPMLTTSMLAPTFQTLDLDASQTLKATSQKSDATSRKLDATSQTLKATSQKSTASPLPAIAKNIEQSSLEKLSKERHTGENKEAEIKSSDKKMKRNQEEEERYLRKMPRMRTSRRSRNRRIPLCMSRCLGLGLLHPAQCHSLCS